MDIKALNVKQVVEILKSYITMKNEESFLEFEINNKDSSVSSDDVIEIMTFPPCGVRNISGNYDSDKISDIAGHYSELTNRLNLRNEEELKNDLKSRQNLTRRIEHYIECLNGRQSQVLRKIYMDGKTVAQVSEELQFSETTVKRDKKAGEQRLTDMFNMVIRH